MSEEKINELEFAIALFKAKAGNMSNYGVASRAHKAIRLARVYSRLQVEDCNRGLTGAERTKERKLIREIEIIFEEINPQIKVLFGGDPRGATIKLKLPTGEGNSFGDRTDYCVPGS